MAGESGVIPDSGGGLDAAHGGGCAGGSVGAEARRARDAAVREISAPALLGGLFPEGGRSPDGEVQPFNEGAFQLAIREQVPILPLVVEGTGKALPAKTWLWGKSRDIQLRVLEAIPVEGRGVKEAGALRDAVRQKIVDELDRLRHSGQLASTAAEQPAA